MSCTIARFSSSTPHVPDSLSHVLPNGRYPTVGMLRLARSMRLSRALRLLLFAWNLPMADDMSRNSSCSGLKRLYSDTLMKKRMPCFLKVSLASDASLLPLSHLSAWAMMTASNLPRAASLVSRTSSFRSHPSVACYCPPYCSTMAPPRSSTSRAFCFRWVCKDSPLRSCFSVLTRMSEAKRMDEVRDVVLDCLDIGRAPVQHG